MNHKLVVPIKLAINLNELALPQDSFYYYEILTGNIIIKGQGEVLCSAYLVDELLEFMPSTPEKDGYTFYWNIERLPNLYRFSLKGNQIDSDETIISFDDKEFISLIARVLIYFLKEEYIFFN
jgi:hypothetical protein